MESQSSTKPTSPLHPENQTSLLAALGLTLLLLVLVYGFIAVVSKNSTNPEPTSNISGFTLECPLGDQPQEVLTTIGEAPFTLEIAASFEQRVCGLSNRRSLDQDKGLLFVFEESAKHGFWMKDMRFPIDIVWLDQAGSIVFIAKDIAPETYPEVFTPDQDALYVLEINAGQAETLGLEIGTTIPLLGLTDQ